MELRVFTEESLKGVLCGAGFGSVRFAAEDFAEFGVENCDAWSLPIAARKGDFRVPAAELALEYREAKRLAARKIRDLEAIRAEYERHIAFHSLAHEEWKKDTAVRMEWTKKVEADWEERTRWAKQIDVDRREAVAEFERLRKSEAEAWTAVEAMAEKLKASEAEMARVKGMFWARLGRKFGVM